MSDYPRRWDHFERDSHVRMRDQHDHLRSHIDSDWHTNLCADAPRTEIATLKKDFYSTEAVLARSARTEKVFLGYLVRLLQKIAARRSEM